MNQTLDTGGTAVFRTRVMRKPVFTATHTTNVPLPRTVALVVALACGTLGALVLMLAMWLAGGWR